MFPFPPGMVTPSAGIPAVAQGSAAPYVVAAAPCSPRAAPAPTPLWGPHPSGASTLARVSGDESFSAARSQVCQADWPLRHLHARPSPTKPFPFRARVQSPARREGVGAELWAGRGLPQASGGRAAPAPVRGQASAVFPAVSSARPRRSGPWAGPRRQHSAAGPHWAHGASAPGPGLPSGPNPTALSRREAASRPLGLLARSLHRDGSGLPRLPAVSRAGPAGPASSPSPTGCC